MKFFQIDTLGDLKKANQLVVNAFPQSIGAEYICLAKGHPLTGVKGSDTLTVSTKPGTEDDQPGTILSDILGNTCGFLMTSTQVKILFQQECTDIALEIFGFKLLKPDDTPWSSDYFYLNPVGALDVLNYEKSDILRFKDTERIIKIKSAVLDQKKANSLPKFFRVKHWESNYLVREDLAEKLSNSGVTNLVLKDVPIS